MQDIYGLATFLRPRKKYHSRFRRKFIGMFVSYWGLQVTDFQVHIQNLLEVLKVYVSTLLLDTELQSIRILWMEAIFIICPPNLLPLTSHR